MKHTTNDSTRASAPTSPGEDRTSVMSPLPVNSGHARGSENPAYTHHQMQQAQAAANDRAYAPSNQTGPQTQQTISMRVPAVTSTQAQSGGMPHAGAAQTHRRAPEAAHAAAPSRKPSRGPLITLGVIAALLALAYGGGVWAFSNICYPNTHIAGVDVSLMPRDTATDRVQAAAENYRLTISGDGFEWTYEPESSADILDGAGAVGNVIDANEPWAWPVRLVQALMGGSESATVSGDTAPDDGADSASDADGSDGTEDTSLDNIPLPASFDREAFTAELGAALEAFNANRTGTFDSAGAFDAEKGAFTLERARANQKLDATAIERAALIAISQLTPTVELDGSSYVPLANGATDEQLQAALDAANELIAAKIDLTYAGTTVATLDGATMAAWMTFDDQLNPTLNTDMVTTWARELAASTLDTVGTARTYTREDGKQVSVSGGTYGWVSDEAALVSQLQQAVAAKQTTAIEIPTKQKGDTFAGAGQRDWGAYIDIDLSEQYARYYDASGNILWESGVITGNPNKGYDTPTGVYMINSNSGGATLVGADYNNDGEPDYKTPVAYWMPFVGGAVGLHDADWQASSNFGRAGVEYSVGSHGCVNLPPAKARELHELISTGLCVVSHY